MAGWEKINDMTHVGHSYTRVDGIDKVTGRAKYTYDVQFPGMLYGKILHSPHPHAKIRNIDAGAVEKLAGVRAVSTDIKSEVLFAGDDVAAVAAETEDLASQAAELFQVDYEVLPFSVEEEQAKKQDAPKVFSGRSDNLGEERTRQEGNIAQGFMEADVVLERTFRLQVQIHNPLEAHGCVAKWEGGELFFWDSTQAVHGMRSALARHFDIPENKVHVTTDHMGGGFGSKLGPKGFHYICAELAKKAGAPVKLMLDRQEELLETGNRPSSIQKIKIGAKKDGTFTAFEMQSYGSGGIGGGAGVPQPYIYSFPNYKVTHRDVYMNTGPAAPMRAPGHPQANFAMESIVDELADKLDMDPLVLRQKNDPNSTRQKEYKIGAEKMQWDRRQKSGTGNGTVKRGLGMGSGRWGGGGVPNTKAIVSILADGSVEVNIGTQDIGTGTRTIATAVAAEELGLAFSEVKANIGKSDYPWAPSSGGSRTAPSISPAIKRAAAKAKAKLIEKVAEELEAETDNVVLENKTFSVKDRPEISLSWKKACQLLQGRPVSEMGSWGEGLSDSGTAGCQFAEVEVDTETGQVKVVKMVGVQDCGLVLNKLTAENQVKGAMIGEIGYVLYETRIMDQPTGTMVNTDMENYKIPGTLEMPEFEVVFFDESERGVIGLGEPPAIPGVGAIANAVANAIGVRIYELPITPDKILNVLAAKQEGAV